MGGGVLVALVAGLWCAGESAASNAPVIHQRRLGNGLLVITRRNPAAPTVAVAAAIRVSAASELGWEVGIRRLIAQCLHGSRDGGGWADAVVTDVSVRPDLVMVTGRAPDRSWQAAVAHVLDLVFKVHFDISRVRAAQAILRRADEAENEVPTAVASRAGLAALYPAAARYMRPAVAWAPVTLRLIRQFYRAHFTPNTVAIAVSGPVEAPTVEGYVEEATRSLLPGPAKQPAGMVALPMRQRKQRIVLAADQSVVWFGARAPRPGAPDYAAAIVAVTMMAQGMGSRLFRRLREELSLAYTVQGQVMAGNLWPYMYVMCTCKAGDVSRAAAEINDELERAGQELAEAAEVERARRVAETEVLKLQMSNWQGAQYLATVATLLPDSFAEWTPARLAHGLSSVEAEEVREVVRKWWSKRTVVEVVGRGGNAGQG